MLFLLFIYVQLFRLVYWFRQTMIASLFYMGMIIITINHYKLYFKGLGRYNWLAEFNITAKTSEQATH